MAQKADKDFINDTRLESKKSPTRETNTQNSETDTGTSTEQTETKKPDPEIKNSKEPEQSAEQLPPPNDEFKKKFEEYFKEAGAIIAGQSVVEMIDGLKAQLLWIYAQKNGVNATVDMFKMEGKSKEFASFLVDYGIKNKLFGVIEKYPLAAAGGVLLLSGLSSWGMIEMMKKSNSETDKLKAEIERLKKNQKPEEKDDKTDIKEVIKNLDNNNQAAA